MTAKNIKAATTEQSHLAIKQIPHPVAAKETVIIKNKYLGINFADVQQVHGRFPILSNNVVGFEGAGEVVEVGKGVTKYKVGDRVLALGEGSHAEYFLATELDTKTVQIPDNVSYETAAALGGDVVLVHAAAGGVGSLLVQLIHQKGTTVIGTVSTDEKAAFAKKLGADYNINYKENVLERVLESTNGEGVHAVLDSVGGKNFEDSSIKAVRYNGTVIF